VGRRLAPGNADCGQAPDAAMPGARCSNAVRGRFSPEMTYIL